MKREKRLKKGIDSIEEQIKIHDKKLKMSKEEGDFYLSDYYVKEIAALKKRLEDRRDKLVKEDN